MGALIARQVALGHKGRRATERLKNRTDLPDQVLPVDAADGVQGRHRVAHTDVVGRVSILHPRNQRVGIDLLFVQPGRPGTRGAAAQAQCHLRQKARAQRRIREAGVRSVQMHRHGGFVLPATPVGGLLCGPVAGDPVGQPRQVLHQHDAQGDGDRPQLTQSQRIHLLIGL